MPESPTQAGPPSVAVLIEALAADAGDRTALMRSDGSSLSRAELARRTRLLAQRLNALAIAPTDRVAVLAPNGIDMALAVLGTMRVAACAPLNPQYGPAELAFYLDDLAARALVVTGDSPALAREIAAQRGLPVIEAGEALWATGDAPLPPTPASDDIALVLHTSGTTSRPKQVPLSHANLAASMAHIVAALQLVADDCALNAMPLFHIHGLVAGLLAPLAAGGRTMCAPALRLPDFFDWLDACGATWYSAVPTMHQAVLAAADGRRPRRPLRFVRSSSAALAPATLAALEAHFGCPVIEAYGMTEAAHQMASNPLPPAVRKPGSVGLPAGPEIAVIDAAGAPLATGTRGEIAIRGTNVMRAYHAHPEANRSAFTAGWFRTGDEGYVDADGYLHITGRLKEMINRGGEKITPREIDEALLAHPDVAQAVAFAVPHPTLGEDVAAAVVPRPGSTIGPEALREFLFGRLADFKVPSEVLLLAEIPKGPTGKVQRIGLADRLQALRTPDFVAPRDVVEDILVQCWREVLGGDIGVHDNFFALGGDSLKATRVVARIVSVLPVELPTALLFRHPTVAALADAVRQTLDPSVIAEIECILDELAPLPAAGDEQDARPV
ncbi:non-ribosomal peptide synthetase [Methyloversatilis sp. NSM2]|uniref:non-ribosomal peptide synthetase n=1 Tax=Methyloversatilis sp. NSM2 TaxID=3134135 RepID=UPI003110694E